MNRFERARILAARVLQLAMGAKPLVKIKSDDLLEIAKAELEAGLLPFETEIKKPNER